MTENSGNNQQDSAGKSGSAKVGGFQIVSRIGRGGMGAVYKARQISLDRMVALKILPPALAEKPDFITRFMREARAAARLSHPNIVAAIDVGDADGYHYFAMEFVEGETASAALTREKRFSTAKTIKMLGDVSRGLAHAHENGLIHRDVKPQNMLIEKNGNVKLCDLGLARSTQEDSTLTQTGTAMGTPYYMSPEQIAGSHDIDARTDIYSLGAVGYHMLTGRPPYEAETGAMVMAKHVSERLKPLAEVAPDVDPALAAVMEKCLKKKP
ncbi:serine/threonine-protein kinase, partial [Planctomycetota bacterium]